MTTKTDQLTTPRKPGGGVRRGFDIAYGYLAGLFVLGVLVQVFLAGEGVFGINARKVANASSLNAHRTWGGVLMVLAVVLLILALAAWQSARTVIATVILAVLVTVAQSGLASAGEHNKWVGGLHAFDGMLILLLALWLAIAAFRRQKKNLDHPA
ncbi:MAG TPA: hypothetical protein VG253_22270 [Streptosporangiaceae bacterium]|jgi:hypothetical protein|nr:hypothetical protein [Streptosporangiaceae bacterium]